MPTCLTSGVQQLPPNFWEKHGKGMESWQQQSRTFYRVRGPLVREWQPNQFVYDPGENGVEAIVRKLEGESAILELTRRLPHGAQQRLGRHARAIASRISP